MKKIISTLLSFTMVIALWGCTSKVPTEPNPEFITFCDEYTTYTLQEDFTTMHQMVENPKDFGVDVSKMEVSLGKVEADNEEELKDWKSKLESFNYNKLDATQRTIYDQILSEIDFQLRCFDEKFDLSGNLWSSMSGTHEQLITFFSEYVLRNEDDIPDLITLINDTPRYVNDVLDYTKRQADQDMLCFDYETVMKDIQSTIDEQENSSVYKELYKEVDQLNLSEEKSESYKKQIKDALDASFFPSYQTMKKELTPLKGKVQPVTGVANLKNGKEYYKLLLESSIGSKTDVETVRKNLEDETDAVMDEFKDLIYGNPNAYLSFESFNTGFKDIDDILVQLLKDCKEDFPEVSDMDYELTPLEDDQSTNGVVAYFVIPAIDNTQTRQMRYNKRDYGKDTDDVELYTTLAHEGVAGHMYQDQYNHDNLEYPIQFLLSNSGFTEGYATYVQFYVLKYLNDPEGCSEVHRLNELLTYYYIGLMDISVNYDGMSLKDFNKEYGALFGTDDLKDVYYQLADNPTVFLSYYYGYYQIMELKTKAQNQLGDKYSDIEFHDALLQSGAVNFDIISRNIENYIKETK